MFDLYCPHCSTRRLMFAGQVRDMVNDADGVHVVVECWCGGLVLWSSAAPQAARSSTEQPVDLAAHLAPDLARAG